MIGTTNISCSLTLDHAPVSRVSLTTCTIEAYIWGWWKGFPATSSGGKTGSFT